MTLILMVNKRVNAELVVNGVGAQAQSSHNSIVPFEYADVIILVIIWRYAGIVKGNLVS